MTACSIFLFRVVCCLPSCPLCRSVVYTYCVCEFYARARDACSCIKTSVYIEVFEKNIEDIISILRRRCSCSFCRRTPGALHLFLPTAKEKQVLSMTINKTPVVKTSENEAHSIQLQYIQAPFRNVAFFFSNIISPEKKKSFFILKNMPHSEVPQPSGISKLLREQSFFQPSSHPLFGLLDFFATNMISYFVGFPYSIFLYFSQ